MDRDSALEATVALSASIASPPHPGSLVDVSGNGIVAFRVVPSITPEPMAEGPFFKLNTRYLPDWEMLKSESCRDASDLPHLPVGRFALFTPNFQTPSTEIGATSPRPDLRTPASPNKGKATRTT
jgi:hypothetical protein